MENIIYISALQCDDQSWTHYNPCVTTCEYETCETLTRKEKIAGTCKDTPCIEGCAPRPCPEDYIYLNSSLDKCVKKNTCGPVCLVLNGTTYYDGDVIRENECYYCICENQKEICFDTCLATTSKVSALKKK